MEITFQARVWNNDSIIKAAQRLAKQKGYRMGVWKEGMRVVLCPMGYLDFGWVRESGIFGHWQISGGCTTTPGGPGLHKAAIDFLEQLGQNGLKELDITDWTGYLENRDFEALRQKQFIPWLSRQIEAALERLEQGRRTTYLFWEADQYLPQEIPDTVVTPMGRFSKHWLKETELCEIAHRLFLWENPEQDGWFFRNCALKRMWEDCWYAPSDRSGDDAQTNQQIIQYLEKASALDATLPLPVSEYRELCILDYREPQLPPETPELEEEFLIGYRRDEVIQPFDALRIPLPGLYHYEWSKDRQGHSGGIWWDADSISPIWRFSGYRNPDGKAEWVLDLSQTQDREEVELPGGGRAHWGWNLIENKEDPEDPLYQVAGEVLVGSILYQITVTYGEAEERESIYQRLHRIWVETDPDRELV